jgi:Fe-Mn family superoxide dismutase
MMELSRRSALKAFGAGTVGLLVTGAGCLAQEGEAGRIAAAPMAAATGKRRYELGALPYQADALGEVLDAETVAIHHGKHHAGYVTGANRILDQLDEARASGDYSRIQALSRGLAFTAAGVVLHELYWQSMSPEKQDGPSGRLAAQLASDFGSVSAFGAQFAAAAKAVEASGWAVLVWEPLLRQLLVLQIEKHQDLAIWGSVPLVVCDVWEHAYYLRYQNRRAEYVDHWMKVIDWRGTGDRFDRAVGGR